MNNDLIDFTYRFYKTFLLDMGEPFQNSDLYVCKGVVFCHKSNLKEIGCSKILSQILVYLSRLNRDGVPVPKTIMIVDNMEQMVYLYDTYDYSDIINNISEYATLGLNQGIKDFIEKNQGMKISFDLDDISTCVGLKEVIMKSTEYLKVDITKDNVYGWSQYFYKHSKGSKKVEFFRELRNPKNELVDFINPWVGEESDFSLIMDLLNDPSQQKKLGAFYTPPLYAEKAVEFVREAIKRVPVGNDYIILDRCAGTGSLELGLTEEELKHVVINTYELKEWHALNNRFGKLVRHILPLISDDMEYPDYDEETGYLLQGNALSKEFLENDIIMQYVNNPNCTVILLENPPYSDDSGDAHKTGVSRGSSKNNYFSKLMNEKVKPSFPGLIQSKDIANLFIWSAFEYYMKKENDAYILLSPLKYWKTGHLVNKKLMNGCFMNRKHFHATPSVVSCLYWSNIDKVEESITLPAYDIINEEIKWVKDVTVRRVHKTVNGTLFDKRIFDSDTKDGIYSASTGLEGQKLSATSTENIYNDNILAYLYLIGFSFDAKHIYLTRNTLNYRKNGFYLRRDNFEKKLPLFCAKAFPQDNWYETDVYSTTGDGGINYEQDKEFLKKCLIWSCLTQKNKCRSLIGSDTRLYLNELCLDEDTEASKMLDKWKAEGVAFTEKEYKLLNDYNNILLEIKKKDNGIYVYDEYNEKYKYGIYQIDDEINVSVVLGKDKKGKEKLGCKYMILHNMLTSFKKEVQDYYNTEIIDDLLKYELLK